jgi:hypothetical protein
MSRFAFPDLVITGRVIPPGLIPGLVAPGLVVPGLVVPGLVVPGLMVIVMALSGCAGPMAASGAGGGGFGGGSLSRADAATEAACRQRADEVYDRQNRGEIYSPPPGVNTPFSAGYSPGSTDRGLSQLYARDNLIRDCIRNTGTETDRNAAAQAGTAPVQPSQVQPSQVQSGQVQSAPRPVPAAKPKHP